MVQNASGKSNHTCRKKEEKIIHTVHNIYDKTRNILTKLIVDIFFRPDSKIPVDFYYPQYFIIK